MVAFYGAQNIDFVELAAPVIGHFAEDDPFVTDDELVEMQAQLMLLDKHIEFHRYPGAGTGSTRTPRQRPGARGVDVGVGTDARLPGPTRPAGTGRFGGT